MVLIGTAANPIELNGPVVVAANNKLEQIKNSNGKNNLSSNGNNKLSEVVGVQKKRKTK